MQNLQTNNIPSGWRETTLGEISKNVAYGYTESASLEKIGPKFLRITDIQHDSINWDSVPYCKISERDHGKYRLNIGDIVVARTGNSTGATAVIKDNIDAVFASYLIRFQLDNTKVDYRYIDYVLRSSKWKGFIGGFKGGSAQGGINAKTLSLFELDLPALEEQQEIATVLSSLDDKIELLRRQNKTLENMAQAIFKEWFVDFNFPDENGKPYKSSGGKMIESELGEIPEGWRVGKLGDIGKNIKNIINEENISSQFSYIALEHMPQKSIALDTWQKAENINSNKFLFTRRQILFGKLRPYFHKVGVAFTSGVCSTDILVIFSKIPDYYGLLLMYLSSDRFIEYVSQASEGTRMPRTNWPLMANYQIIIPDLDSISMFNKVMESFINKMELNVYQIQNLSRLRDTLLPKLMKGEIRL